MVDAQSNFDVDEGSFPEMEGRHAPLATSYLPKPFMTELTELISTHGKASKVQRPGVKKSVAKVVGFETVKSRYYTLVRSFKELRAQGYKMDSPRNLRQKHVEALARSWEANGLSASTITNRLSVLRHFAEWIGKPGLVLESHNYVADPDSVRRSQVAIVDKSWSSASVDADALIGHVSQFDWRVGLQLKLMQCFGLRLREAVMFKPLKAIDAAMGLVSVRDGTKGGRERVLAIRTDRQKALIEVLLSKVTRVNESLSHPDFDLKQSVRRTKYVATKFGISKSGLKITLHGLRHQYLNDLYFEITGHHSPVRSGNIASVISALEHDIARALVSKEAGHARVNITNAYIGSERAVNKGIEDAEDRLRTLSNKMHLNTRERAELSELVEHFLSQKAAAELKSKSGKSQSNNEDGKQGQLDI